MFLEGPRGAPNHKGLRGAASSQHDPALVLAYTYTHLVKLQLEYVHKCSYSKSLAFFLAFSKIQYFVLILANFDTFFMHFGGK